MIISVIKWFHHTLFSTIQVSLNACICNGVSQRRLHLIDHECSQCMTTMMQLDRELQWGLPSGRTNQFRLRWTTVNYVVAKRFAKPQQMQWNSKSVHLLSQMRIRVLNGELEQTFKEWYPCFRMESKQWWTQKGGLASLLLYAPLSTWSQYLILDQTNYDALQELCDLV